MADLSLASSLVVVKTPTCLYSSVALLDKFQKMLMQTKVISENDYMFEGV